MRVLIVDDEPLAREGLRLLLEQETDIEIVGECGNGKTAVAAIAERMPDIIFLDVQMPGLDGFGVVAAIGPENMPAVIFVTAYDEFAIRAFEVNALDYLLKPVEPERFSAALARARRNSRTVNSLRSQLQALIGEKRAEYLTRLAIKRDGRIIFIDVSEIDWIEAADNYVKVHTGRISHLINGKISALETRLDPANFLRVHRSIIINIGRIKELQPLFHGEYLIILKDDVSITTGRSYRQKIQELIENQF